MEYLSGIVNSFDKKEQKFLLQFYQSALEFYPEQKKIYQIIKTVIEEGTMTDNELLEFLSWEKTPLFYKLKILLREELQNHIIYLNPVSINTTNSSFNAEIECDKLILTGKILINKDLNLEAKKLLTHALKIAIEYDLQLQQLTINDLLRIHNGARMGWKEAKKIIFDMNQNLAILKYILKAKDLCQFIDLNQSFQSNQKENLTKDSLEALKKIKKMYTETNSPTVGFYYYLAGSTFHRIIKDYKGAIQYSVNLIELINKHKAIRSNKKLAIANSHLAMAYINLFDFEQACQFCHDSIRLFTKNSLNELRAMEIYYSALINSNRINEANNLIKKALLHPQIHTSQHTDSLWKYFQAVLFFIERKPMKSLKILSKLSKILMDKYGWFMGSKILELMCCIEANKVNLYLYRMEALIKTLERREKILKTRKRIKTHYDSKQNLSRIKLIYFICQQLVENNFNFKTTLKVCNNEMKLLTDGEDIYSWNPIGYELIRFDSWFRSKIKPNLSPVIYDKPVIGLMKSP